MYELEHSLDHVHVDTYELEPSSYDQFIACSSLFFIVHMFYRIKISEESGVTVRCSFGFAYVLARPSVGWESWGSIGSSLVCGRGVQIREGLRI